MLPSRSLARPARNVRPSKSSAFALRRPLSALTPCRCPDATTNTTDSTDAADQRLPKRKSLTKPQRDFLDSAVRLLP